MTKDLMKFGFSQRDIVVLIQDRTKPKMPMKSIQIMLKAIIKFENDYLEFQKIVKDVKR